jgi:hypothetical protein
VYGAQTVTPASDENPSLAWRAEDLAVEPLIAQESFKN